MQDDPHQPGEPRFYGRRTGRRLRAGRRRLLDTLLPAMAVRLPAGNATLDPRTLFDRPVRDVWLEIGFGAGEHLIAQARAHRRVGFIGCEPFINGVATLLAEVEAARPDQELDNIRVHADDARTLLPRLAEGSLGRVFVLFADPWPKRRHHRRRIMAPDVLDTLARLLRDGGELIFASDDASYVRWTLALLLRHPAYEWTARRPSDWRRPPKDGFPTRYQEKAIETGRRPYYLVCRRIG
jgi:tRNA (guanine-N7-)-methyltransferase